MSNLQEVLGEPTTLSDSPCIGRCSTTWGDDICKGCGRSNKQIREWPSYTSLEKKLINLSLAKKFQAKKKMSDKKHPIKELDNTYWEIETGEFFTGEQIKELEDNRDTLISELKINTNSNEKSVLKLITDFCKSYEKLCQKKYPEAPLPLEILKSIN